MEALLATIALLVATVAMVALAVWILVLKANSSVNLSFATHLLLFGLALAVRAWRLNVDRGMQDSLEGALVFLQLSAIGAFAYFGAAYFGWRRSERLRFTRWTVLAATAGLLLWLVLDPCIYACASASGERVLGPVALLNQSYPLATGLLAVAMVWDWLARTQTIGQSGTLPLAFAFMANALFLGALLSVGLFDGKPPANLAPGIWRDIFESWLALPLVAGGATFIPLAMAWNRGRITTAQWFGALSFGVVAVASGFWLAFLPPGSAPVTPVTAAWRILVPLLAAYALVRHRLFGIEVHVRQGLGRAIVGVAVLAVAFGLGWGAESIWPGIGNYVGWGVALVLALAISPLDKLGQRLARALMPDARPSAEMSVQERLAVYRDRVATILADGRMAVQDRLVLDRLRDQLMLPIGWATRIEREAWSKAMGKKGGPAGLPPWVDPPEAGKAKG